MIKPVMLACSAGLLLTACATDRTDYSSTYSDGYTSGTIQEGSGAQSGWQQSTGTRTTQQEYTQQQQRFSTGQQQYQGQQAYSGQTGQSQQMQGEQVVIPLHEEQLRVGTRTVDAGTVTIRKIVTTETVNQPVELRRERLVIDRQGGGAQFGATQQQQQGQFRAQAGTQGAEIQSQAQFSEPAGAAPSQQQQNWASGSGAAFQEQTYTIQLREEQPIVEKNVVQTGQVVARKTSETQRQNVQQQVRREDVRLDQGSARNVEVRGNINTAGQIREPAGAERQDKQLESEVQMERDVEIREPAGAQRDERMRYETETEIRTDSGIQQQEGVPVRQGRGAFEDFREGSGTRGGAAELRGLDQRSDR